MMKRLWGGLLGAAILLAVLLAGKWAMHGLIIAAACVSHYEMMRAMQAMNCRPMFWPGFLYCAAIVPVYLLGGSDGLWVLTVVMILLTLATRVFSKKRSTLDAFASLASFIYPLPFFIFFVLAFSLPDPMGFSIILIGIVLAIMTDTFSYFAGVALGKHKLAPAISPKKTVEGAIGGFVGSIASSVALFFLQDLWGAAYPLWAYCSLGILCAFVGPIGDLAASAIKRQAGIKDFGNLIPGHGGMLDRADSILFAVPVVYAFFRFVVMPIIA